MNTYTDIIARIARTAAADVNGTGYLTESLVAIVAAEKVTRLDLHNVLSYIFDEGAETRIEGTDGSIGWLVAEFNKMDKAAAFGTDEYPLVMFASGSVSESVMDGDSPTTAAAKREAQTPSTHDFRFDAKGNLKAFGTASRKA